MHRIPLLAGLALAHLSAAPALAQMITLSPSQIGEIFCIARLGNYMAPVTGLLTRSLGDAIAEAEAKNTEAQRQAPGDKPPLGDGIQWQSAPDYAALCSVGAVSLDADAARVAIEYGFPDSPAANFADTLQLQLVPGEWPEQLVWRIDDVVYADGLDLRAVLLSAFALN